METFSAFHVSTGPTEIACVGTSEMFPPPDVRAFWAMVSGCKSTTRVASLRYSAGDGGAFLYLPVRFGGSLKAQCLTSPWPPCITAQRTPASQLLRYAVVSPLGKCKFSSGITKFLRMRLKQSSRSAFSKERSEEHTSELQSPCNLVCRLLLEKKKTTATIHDTNTLQEPLIVDRATCKIFYFVLSNLAFSHNYNTTSMKVHTTLTSVLPPQFRT